MGGIGILAYGSLIDDPGSEIESATVRRIERARTPFKVEYARSSRGRGGGPTLVPVEEGGAPVDAVILVLREDISEYQAADMLWRRETNQVGSGRNYSPAANPGRNAVVVERLSDFRGVGVVLYTRIAGNIEPLTANRLGELAIASAQSAEVPTGRDGISYLIAAKKNSIVTPLTAEYEKEILRRAGVRTLEDAVMSLRARRR